MSTTARSGWGVYGSSVLPSQFFYESKTLVKKKKVYFISWPFLTWQQAAQEASRLRLSQEPHGDAGVRWG